MKYTKILAFISLLLTLNLSATTYEDGEDKEISRWHILKPSSLVTVENVYDESKDSQVIEFKGEGTKSAYILMSNEGATWENKEEKVLHWQMKYSEDFVILVSLETKRGKRYLIYTPGNKNGYMQYGLGESATNGVWQQYSRNLEEDLKYFDNQNSIVMVNTFVIRGSGCVDNIKMMKENFLEDKKSRITPIKKEKPMASKIEKKSLKKIKKVKKSKKIKKVKTNSTPSLIMEGENPIFLTVGETYEEPGVIAKDKEDGELIVTSSENIDKYKEGKYAVIYMATDSEGNSVIDKRYVIVGQSEAGDDENSNENEKEHSARNKQEQSDVASTQEKDVASTQENDEIEYRIEERELEIAEWEKELQLREKEISQREQNIQRSIEVQNQIQ